MKNKNIIITVILMLIFSFASVQNSEAQILKRLKKKAENAATRKLEKKTAEQNLLFNKHSL